MAIEVPELIYASPRKLPKATRLNGRVVVLDIAFASDGLGKGFEKTTGKFIEQLGPRLAKWVDHHDHPRHASFVNDERFVLATKAEHGACPEMIDPDMVRLTGPVDTIVAHFDLDGIYAAAKWILGGKEPYPGADDDARVVDTRIGTSSKVATEIDYALRAHYHDVLLKHQVINYLIHGCKRGVEKDAIDRAALDYRKMAEESVRLAEKYEVADEVAFISIPPGQRPFDKTELLLLGQKKAITSAVLDVGNVTIASAFDSGLNFVDILELGGGMPTRVNIPENRLESALVKIKRVIRDLP